MITLETSRNGMIVLKKCGVWLGSSIDPNREAVSWARAAVAGLDKAESILVMGIGSGHHVAELIGMIGADRVLVVEGDPEVVTQALLLRSEISSKRVVCEPVWSKLIENVRFSDFVIGGPVRVVKHAPSVQVEKDYFEDVSRLLSARDKLSFLLQLKMRTELAALLDADMILDLGDEAISIKTMQKIFSPNCANHRERRIWRVLEELVK